MAFTRSANTTTASKPSLLGRLKGNNRTVTTTTKHSTNPITGSRTTTTTKKETGPTHHTSHHTGSAATTSRGVGSGTRHTTGHRTTGTTGTTRVQKRKPTVGDKVSGAMMNLKGTVTGKPGVKGAGTRRMNGTDGKGSHYTRTY
ncbi:hypothetical protein QM012_004854 [Aureobasidium pullulans]|uniref:Uncharacterized protein n=1 Tax=Aureobasidium pullulans TaxID=5580 RepID=A0ABR0TUB8_AURPU